MTTTIVTHSTPNIVWNRVKITDQSLDRKGLKPFLACDRIIQIGDVSGVVLAVMNLHRASVNMRLKSVERIRKIG